MCKALGVTVLGLFVVEEDMKHPVGLYLYLTVFHSASGVAKTSQKPGELNSQSRTEDEYKEFLFGPRGAVDVGLGLGRSRVPLRANCIKIEAAA